MTKAPKRKPMSKKLRFEVFKRDRFTCQYCGAKAPDAILHVDHIKPVADDGDDNILNLVTACQACNSGKGARLLDDRSIMDRQRAQLEELEARREQLEMMLQWRDQAEAEKIDTIAAIGDRLYERGGFEPSENGRNVIRRWLKRYTVAEILSGIDEAFDVHMTWDKKGKPIMASWVAAFNRTPTYIGYQRTAIDKPYMQRLAYIQGIFRRRLDTPYMKYLTALEEIHLAGLSLEGMEDAAKIDLTWDEFTEVAWAVIEKQRTERGED